MSKTKINYFQIAFIFLSFFIFITIILNPNLYLGSVSKGILLWATIILPGLVPFVFLSNIMSKLPYTYTICAPLSYLTKKCFRSPICTGYIYFMSILSGYPLGAKLIKDFHAAGHLTDLQAKTATAFCSTSGPIFMIGSVGVGLLNNYKSGIIIFCAHILASFVNGILFRQKDNQPSTPILNHNPNNLLSNSMEQTVISCIFVGGFISFAYLLIDILSNVGILSIIGNFVDNILLFGKANFGQYLASGMFEVTRGCLDLSQSNLSIMSKTIIATGLTAFGGLSVHLQSMGFLSAANIKYTFFLKTKIAHTVIAVVLSYILCIIFF